MNKALKYTLIIAPIFITGGIIYWQVRKFKVPAKKTLGGLQEEDNTGTVINTDTSGCSFPLKKGSNNACVGQLQDALIAAYGRSVLPRYGADHDWGAETQAAVTSKLGKTQITDAADLAATIISLQAARVTVPISTKALSLQLIAQYQGHATSFKYIKCLNSTPWLEVQQNQNEQWVLTGAYLDVHSGLQLSTKDYEPMPLPDNNTGKVVVYCNRGANMGYYIVDPASIKLI